MADRPEDLPTWATGTTVVVEPTLAERAAGWAVRQRVSSALLNGIFRTLGQWAEYFDRQTVKRYDTTDAMWAEGVVGVGETVSISEPSTAAGTVTTLTSLGADVTAVATDGRRVYCLTTTIRRAVTRLDGTQVWNTSGATEGGSKLATDGRFVVRHSNGNALVGSTPATGAPVWSRTLNTTVHGLAVMGAFGVVGSPSVLDAAGTFSLRLFNAETGAIIWGVNDHTTWACTLSGTDAYVAASNDGLDLVLRRYALGSSTAAQTVTLDNTASAPTLQMLTDGELVYACRAQTTGALLCVSGRDLATTVWSANITGGVDQIALDDRYLYAHVVGATTVRAYDRLTGRLAREVEVGSNITGLAADGQYLYVARAGTADLVARVVVARRRPRVWQVADVSDSHRPFPWALIPGGA